jgi:hypothetical protein
MRRTSPSRPAVAELVAVIYELLDAHGDTADLVGIPRDDLRWRAHLEYLRALQRKGRQLLARLTSEAGER